MPKSIAPAEDEVVVSTLVLRVIASPESGLDEEPLVDLRDAVADHFESLAVSPIPGLPAPGVRVAWTVEP